MPSNLTRSVFRRLLSNKPIVPRGCLRRRQYSSLNSISRSTRLGSIHNGAARIPYQQARNFWNLNIFAKKDQPKEADMDPGTDKMMELAKRQRMRARMPPVEDVVKALGQFFENTEKKHQPINDTHAQLVLQSLKYYLKCTTDPGEPQDFNNGMLQRRLIKRAVLALRRNEVNVKAAHVELAQLLRDMTKDSVSLTTTLRNRILETYIHTLCMSGSTGQARSLVLEQMEFQPSDGQPLPSEEENMDGSLKLEEEERTNHSDSSTLAKVWTMILKGFTRERKVPEVLDTLGKIQMLKPGTLAASQPVASVMLEFNRSQGDLSEVMKWWKVFRQKPMDDRTQNITLLGHELDLMLKWCLRQEHLDAGHEIVRDVMTQNPPKPVWDAILVWAAGTKKSVDEIDRMMSIMEKSNESISDQSMWRVPDVATINGLVEYAISRNDPYMAERFISLGRDRNIEPDARTYVLQMEYRLGVEDVDGALIAYKNLQSMDLSSNEDVPAVNRLIVALCKTQRHDFDTIMNVTADLSDRRARFDPNTVSTLSLLHLNRGEEDDVADLLNTHAYHFASGGREHVRDTLMNYALDSKTPNSRAWQAYNIISKVFDETPRAQRTELMTSFISRERADMGVRIFQGMRMHSRADTIPTVDTYVSAFMGLAKLRDLESFEVVHNLLNIDYNVTVNTHLRNALIIGYTACDKGRKALGFWDEIVKSREGPSYNSIHVALRACEKTTWGDLAAKEIWSLLRRRNVDLDQALWASYVGALAGNGDNDLVIGTVEEAEANGELEVDAFLLGSIFAGANGQIKQMEVENWGKERYPEQWAKLEELGCDSDENGMRAFRIDRRVSP